MTDGVLQSLRCPSCGTRLTPPGEEGVHCSECGSDFPRVGGVLDMRVGVEGFDVEADRRLAQQLADSHELDFEGLLRALWRSRPDVPPALAERFIRADRIGDARAHEVAGQIEDLTRPGVFDGATVLEVGAGTAALGGAVRARAAHVVVTDVSLAWLVVARHRLTAAAAAPGLPDPNAAPDEAEVLTIACTAERLPFDEGTFDVVLAADVIEHVPDPAAFASSCYRVLRPGGHLWLSTPNRLSPTPEPHVRLWGVGLLPHRVAVRYVRLVRGVDYGDIHTLSALGLRRVLRATGGRVRINAAAIAGPVRDGYGPLARRLIDAYDLAAGTPAARHVLLAIAPLFHAVVTKEE